MAARGLATKLSLAIALVVVAAVGLMSLLAVSASRRSLSDQVLASNLTVATLAARAVEQYVTDATRIMSEAPGRPELNQDVRRANWRETQRLLENFLGHLPQFDYVFVQDPHGVVRVRMPHAPTVGQDFSFREFFQQAVRTRELYVSDVYVSTAAQRPVVSIAVPVMDGDRLSGVLVGALSLKALSDVVAAIGNNGAQVSIIDRRGTLIARSDQSHDDSLRSFAALPIVQAALAGQVGTMQLTGPDGRELLGAHVPIPGLGWGVVATRPVATAFAPAERLGRWLLAIGLGCAGLAVLLGWSLARALTEPLSRLAGATQTLAAGDLDVRIPAHGRDEVSALAVSFNHMAEQVQTSYRNLERKTREVEAVNEDLVREIADRRRAEDEVSRLNTALRAQLEELQHTQAQLVQSAKLATLGNLLAGVAHELNNPLAVVLGQATLLRLQTEGAVAERSAKVQQAAERCVRIVKSFLALARNTLPERQRVALNAVVEETLELLGYQLRLGNVEVVRELGDDLPTLWADPHQIQQVALNLVANAVHAMRQVSGPRRLTVRTRASALRDQVDLEIADTGSGIPPAIQARIFEPFFTTKPVGEGTGLGLALCQRIVEGHGGRIELQTESGRGTTFRVELPVLDAPDLGLPERAAEAPLVRGQTILVVDDEPDVAEVLADMLATDGHRVDIVGSGALALDRLRERSYDLILSDVRMPGLDGPGLYDAIEREYPALVARLVFLTGDTLSPYVREFLRRTGRPELGKPFNLTDVQRVVQEALRSSR